MSLDDGTQRVTESSGSTATIGPTPEGRPLPGALQEILTPVGLLARFELDVPSTTIALGRECVSVIGRRRPGQTQDRLPPDPLGGNELEMVVDVESGLLLTWRCWFDRRLLAEVEVDSFEIDAEVKPADFTYTPGPEVDVKTTEQRLAEAQDRLSAQNRTSRSVDWAGQARDHIPRGPAPADATRAEEEIRAAVEGIDEVTADGRDCPNVQGGAGLGVAFEQVGRFLGGRRAHFTFRALRYLTPDEAAISFEVDAGQIHLPVEGRAFRIDGRWLIERRTVTQLLRQGGAEIPYIGDP